MFCEPVTECCGDYGPHLGLMVRVRVLRFKERERFLSKRGVERARRAERERWGFVDCFRVGEKWPFLPFCDEGERFRRTCVPSYFLFWEFGRACMFL